MKDTVVQSDEQQFEHLIDGVVQQEYSVCDNFLTAADIKGLRDNLLAYRAAGLMHPAGVGKNFDYQKNTLIRGDVIRWIERENKDRYETLFMDKVANFVQYLNTNCFTGINDFEFHYAYYEVNSFYKRHLDQFKSDRGRKFSFVMYLNEDWLESDGGALSLYIGDQTISVYPQGGRTAFFKSDETEHEVHPSFNRPRMSIAGWLKCV